MADSKIIAWVVFKDPLDFPGQFVAREFYGESPTEHFINSFHYHEVRDWVLERISFTGEGLGVRLNRHLHDDPAIMEVWL